MARREIDLAISNIPGGLSFFSHDGEDLRQSNQIEKFVPIRIEISGLLWAVGKNAHQLPRKDKLNPFCLFFKSGKNYLYACNDVSTSTTHKAASPDHKDRSSKKRNGFFSNHKAHLVRVGSGELLSCFYLKGLTCVVHAVRLGKFSWILSGDSRLARGGRVQNDSGFTDKCYL